MSTYYKAGRRKTVEILTDGDRPQILLKQRQGLGHIEVITFDGLSDLEDAIAGLQQAKEELQALESDRPSNDFEVHLPRSFW